MSESVEARARVLATLSARCLTGHSMWSLVLLLFFNKKVKCFLVLLRTSDPVSCMLLYPITSTQHAHPSSFRLLNPRYSRLSCDTSSSNTCDSIQGQVLAELSLPSCCLLQTAGWGMDMEKCWTPLDLGSARTHSKSDSGARCFVCDMIIRSPSL